MAQRILGVEDSPVLRGMLKRIVEKAGYDCMLAKDGQEAIDILEQGEKFDLIISDYNMPEKNGLELLRYVRWNSRFDKTLFALVSTDATVSDTDPTSLEKFCQERGAVFRSKVGLVYSDLADELLGRKA